MAKKLNTRRMTDIDRLAAEYKKNVEALTGEYQQSFGAFQAEQSKKMEPFNIATEQYKTAMGEYETKAEDYRSKLSAYQKALEDFPTSEGAKIGSTQTFGRMGTGIYIDGQFYRAEDLPTNYYAKPIYETRMSYPRHSPATPYQHLVGHDVYKRTPPGAFTEKAPVAPEAPTMPELGAFDESAFQAKRAELQSTFKREVGERKAARLGAVSRKSSRPLLQGA